MGTKTKALSTTMEKPLEAPEDAKVKKVKGSKKSATEAKTSKKSRKSDTDSLQANGAEEGNGLSPELNSTKKRKKVQDSASPADGSESPAKKTLKLNGGTAVVPEKTSEDEGDAELNVASFNMRIELQEALAQKGITKLFPIQAQTFKLIKDGSDLVGRARTGQGKTLAFVLPILQSLQASAPKGSRPEFGRAPAVIVLAPTRELAKQVHADFEFYGGALGMSTLCVYGGAPYGPQENALRRGVDIVVGTPGRVKDHLERGSLHLKNLRYRILDEADEMLNMGFVDDVETILGAVEDASSTQTLLFSATLPRWVKQISERFLRPAQVTVDLVKEEKMKASSSVRHLLLPCHWTQRVSVATDLIRLHCGGGRAIIFTETKKDATEMATGLAHLGAQPLHGDIAQAQRETTLAGFRSGRFSVLVATDVAARGLDINSVQLVMQCEPPRDAETYIHRSGRTGRAGATGVSVMLCGPKKEYMVAIIERAAGFKFERVGAPQPSDLALAAAAQAVKAVNEVSDSVVPLFESAAQELLAKASPVEALAKALAKIVGHTDMRARSLLTAHDDAVTLIFRNDSTINTPTFVFNCLRKALSEDQLNDIRRMTLTADSTGAVFDVPSASAADFVDAAKSGKLSGPTTVTLEIAKVLPPLQERPCLPPPRSPGGRFGGGGSRGRGGGGRGRGGGGSSNGKRSFGRR